MLVAYLADTAEKIALEQENAVLRAQIELFKRRPFGTSQSERLDQLLLKLAELEKLQAQTSKPTAQTIYNEFDAPHPRRDLAAAFDTLPVQETVVIKPDEVKANPEVCKSIGKEPTYEVDVIPPRL